MRIRVKVCGITNYEDAVRALDLGADALGFNFYPESPRHIAPDAARALICRLPPLAAMVGVFVNVEDPRRLEEDARVSGVQVLQLHGDESADYCRRLSGWPVIKAVRIGAEGLGMSLHDFPAQAFLFDTRDDRLFGGTGRTLDWEKARRAAEGSRIILAGGLNPANVGDAIRAVQPYGVDVCSGVEAAPGKKDPGKLTAFMREVSYAIR